MEEDDAKGEDEDMIAGVELDVEEKPVLHEKQSGGIKGFFRKLWSIKTKK